MEELSSKLASASPLLGNRPFRRLWAAQFCAVTAVYALTFAGLALVEEQTRSSAWNAVTILSAILPAFLGSVVAGAVVDRFGPVRMLRASHLVRLLVALAFWGAAALLPTGWVLLAVFCTNAAIAFPTQFAMTAEFALLPDYAGQPRLLTANTLFQLSMLSGEGLGVVLLAPLVIKVAGAPAVGLAGALLLLLALALVSALPRPGAAARPSGDIQVDWAALRSDLREGWRAIAQDRVLSLVAIQATLAATMLLILISLLPGLASRHLGLGAEDVPFVLLPGGVGFLLGAVLVNRWERRLSRLAWIGLGLVAAGAAVGLLALLSGDASYLAPVLLLFAGIGMALAWVILPARTVLQERPPEEVRGRVVAAQLALANGAAVLPLLLGGTLADQFGIRPVMGLLGLLVAAAGIAGLRYARLPGSE